MKNKRPSFSPPAKRSDVWLAVAAILAGSTAPSWMRWVIAVGWFILSIEDETRP